MMNDTGTITRVACLGALAVTLLFCGSVGVVRAQELRTQELLLDDDAVAPGTRNTITLQGPSDASLTGDYAIRFPNSSGLGIGSLLFVNDYTAPTAGLSWLNSTANSVLTSDASGVPTWQTISSLLSNVSAEWTDGDSIGLSNRIYATQAMENGSADTVVITDDGEMGLGTASPDGLLTLQGGGDLFRVKDASGSLRSVLNSDGQHDWYLGTFTGEVGQARVGATSGFPSFSLFRPGSTDRFDILNRSTYTAFGYNADGVDTGSVLNIRQGGNVGIGTSTPTTKLHVSSSSDPLRLSGLVRDENLDSILVVDGSGVLHWRASTNLTGSVVDSVESYAWLLTGNTGTIDGTNFLGTIDSVAFNIRVDNSRAFRIEPTASDPNIIGGSSSNSVANGNVGVTIAGGGTHATVGGNYTAIGGGNANTTDADYTTIGGGRSNAASAADATVGGGQANTASGSDATVAGGEDNTASGDISAVGGGDENSATGYGSTVSGGESGTASGNYATVGGGEDNAASANYSTVNGGWQDTASGYASVIGGGEGNTASGSRSTIGGGQLNLASGSRAAIGGGNQNLASEGYTTVAGGLNDTASGYASAIGGGEYNVASGSRAAIGGGGENRASNSYATVAGGMDNVAAGSFTAIPGGRGLTMSGNGAFGFLGDNDAGANPMSISDEDVAVFGNTDLWLANNNSGAGAIRFYESHGTTGSFPGGANYSSFEARSQSSDIRYLLPDTAGIAGDVLGVQSVSGNIITLDWTSGSGGSSGNAWRLTGNSGTNPSNNFLGTTDNVAFEIRVNNTRALRIDPRTASPNITWGYNGNSISTSDDGNVISGGGVSGAVNQMTSGTDYSAIGGGVGNQMHNNSSYSVIGGGQNNRLTSTSSHSVIGGGEDIQMDNSQHSVIGGGDNNRMNSGSNFSGILGGYNNQLSSVDYGVLGGGSNNQLNSNSDYSALVGGSNNQISNSDYGFLGSGSGNQLNSTADYSVLVGGNGSQVTGSTYSSILGGRNIIVGSGSDYSLVVGGQGNQLNSSDWTMIGGGSNNQISGGSDYSFLGSGSNNRLSSNADYTALVGGTNNQIDNSQYAFVGSGNNNRMTSNSQYGAIVGGNNNQIDNGQYSLIANGNNNRLTSGSFYTTILGGSNIQIDNSDYSMIGGGTNNSMNNNTNYAAIVSGQSNTMNSSTNSIIGSGQSNSMNGADYSVIGGGQSNAVTGDYSAIGGGQNNTVSSNFSAIPGGKGLTLSGSGSFGFLGNNSGGNNMTVSTNNVTVLGNTDLWLANNDNSASQARFYEPNSATGTFPSGTNYTSLQSQAQSADINYIFPDTAGVVGDILVVKNVSGTQVTLDWATANETNTVGRLIFARKTTNETSSSTSLQADDDLVLALEAGRTYEISGALYVKRSSGNGSFDVAWDVPTGATMLVSFFANESKSGNSNTGADIRDTDAVGQINGTGYNAIGINTNWNVVHFKGLVVMGSTGGNITQLWAPSGGGTATVHTNSYMGAKLAEN